jgi:hypothetical protein
MIHGGADLTQRLLDGAERLLWEKQDAVKAAAGWQVIKIGRWHRTYRHPALVAAAVRSQERRRRPPRVVERAA